MSAINPKAPTVCPTCESELAPDTQLDHIAQSPLYPEKFELGYGDEVSMLLDYLEALNAALGCEKIDEEVANEHIIELNRLAMDLAQEAKRRFSLDTKAVRELDRRDFALRHARHNTTEDGTETQH